LYTLKNTDQEPYRKCESTQGSKSIGLSKSLGVDGKVEKKVQMCQKRILKILDDSEI